MSSKENLSISRILFYLEKDNVQFSLLIILLGLYLLTYNPIFGILTAAAIVLLVAVEIYVGVKRHGAKAEFKETLITIIFAVALWYALTLLLHTSSPLSAVVSCSMLPNLSRGDIVVVYGEKEYTAKYEINMTPQEFSDIYQTPVVYYKGQYRKVPGSMFSYCQQVSDPLCVDFVNDPSHFIEKRGGIVFKYGSCERKIISTGNTTFEPCVKSVVINGNEYSTTPTKGDIIIYSPKRSDLFSLFGDIVHRAIFKINVNGKHYYLTKGDNNNVFDIQYFSYTRNMANTPVMDSQVKGKVLFNIPYLGYYKLFLSLYVKEDTQCGTILTYN